MDRRAGTIEDLIEEYGNAEMKPDETEEGTFCRDRDLLFSGSDADPAYAATQVVGEDAFDRVITKRMLDRYRLFKTGTVVFGSLLPIGEPNTAKQAVQMRYMPPSFRFATFLDATRFALDREYNNPVKAGCPLSVYQPEFDTRIVPSSDSDSDSDSSSSSSPEKSAQPLSTLSKKGASSKSASAAADPSSSSASASAGASASASASAGASK